jgi:predicted metalloprotease
MMKSVSQVSRRSIVLVVVVVVVVAAFAVFAGEAKALNPDQTSVPTIVKTVYWDLDSYWIPSTRAGVGYFDYWSNGVLIDFSTPCLATGTQHGTEGFYCPSNQAIYLDYNQQVGNVGRFGDGSTAFWTAHEYGHHVEKLLAIDWTMYTPYHELLADCFAGMYFHHGIYTSRTLVLSDYTEAWNQISALSWSDTAHGTPTQRHNAFAYGFRQETNRNLCINGAGIYY